MSTGAIFIIAGLLAFIVVLIVFAINKDIHQQPVINKTFSYIPNTKGVERVYEIRFTDELRQMIERIKHRKDVLIKLGDLYINAGSHHDMLVFGIAAKGVDFYDIGRIPIRYIFDNVTNLKYENVINIQQCINSYKPKIVPYLVPHRLEHSSYGYCMTNDKTGIYIIASDKKVYLVRNTMVSTRELMIYDPKYLTKDAQIKLERMLNDEK